MTTFFQFSIRSLLIAVTIAAVGFAALLYANVWWETTVWTLALVTLPAGVLLIVYRRGEPRAFWAGYTVFGAAFLAAVLCSFVIEYHDHKALGSRPLHDVLATTKAMQFAYSLLPESRRQESIDVPAGADDYAVPPATTLYDANGNAVPEVLNSINQAERVVQTGGKTLYLNANGQVVTLASQPAVSVVSSPNPSFIAPGSFVSIGQALWLLAIAAIGGKVSQFLYRTRPKE